MRAQTAATVLLSCSALDGVLACSRRHRAMSRRSVALLAAAKARIVASSSANSAAATAAPASARAAVARPAACSGYAWPWIPRGRSDSPIDSTHLLLSGLPTMATLNLPEDIEEFDIGLKKEDRSFAGQRTTSDRASIAKTGHTSESGQRRQVTAAPRLRWARACEGDSAAEQRAGVLSLRVSVLFVSSCLLRPFLRVEHLHCRSQQVPPLA